MISQDVSHSVRAFDPSALTELPWTPCILGILTMLDAIDLSFDFLVSWLPVGDFEAEQLPSAVVLIKYRSTIKYAVFVSELYEIIVLLQVSPHEFMQTVMRASQKRFTIDNQGEPVEFWSWMLNSLHLELTGGKRKKSSVISNCFQVFFFAWYLPLPL